MRAWRSWVVWIGVLVWVLSAPARAGAANGEQSPAVLIVNSMQQGVPWTRRFMSALEDKLASTSQLVELHIDYMHTKRIRPSEAYFRAREAVYSYEFSKFKFKLIISIGPDALDMLMRDGNRIFPNTPVLFCGVGSARAAAANTLPLFHGSSYTSNLEANIRFALATFPDTRRIVFVHDQTTSGLDTGEEARALAGKFRAVRFEFLTNLTMPDLLARIHRLPADAILMPLAFTVDASGKLFVGDSPFKMISNSSPVPMIGLWGFEIRDNILGGDLLDESEGGTLMGEAALRVIGGEDIKNVRIPSNKVAHWLFDYPELQRFGVAKEALPPGSVTVGAARNFIHVHASVIALWSVMTLILLAAVIILLVGLNRIKRAEAALEASERQKRFFYREAISCVTDGKLQICEAADVESYIRAGGVAVSADCAADVSCAREVVMGYCAEHGLEGDDLRAFMLGVGEAVTNAIKHAPRGEIHMGRVGDDVWVGVVDYGPGISSLLIPRATLYRGFSTQTSMGLGFSIMLDVSDRLLLKTDESGTTVILIKHIRNLEQPELLERLPDTWDNV